MIPLVISGITIPHAYTLPSNVSLVPGANNIQAVVVYNGQTYSDSVTWSYHAAALGGTPWRGLISPTPVPIFKWAMLPTPVRRSMARLVGSIRRRLAQPPTRRARITAPRRQPRHSTKSKIELASMLPTNRIWEYSLPNGTYDIHLVAADSTNPNAVNNLLVQNITVHDLDSTDFGDNGFDEFYVTVTVTNGHLTVAAAPGSVAPRLAAIDINAIDNTPPSIVGSNFQYAAPEQLQLKFNVNVSASLTASDLQLVNQTTGQTIDPSNIGVSYDTSSNTATFSFPGFANGLLPVGNYQMSIASGNVVNSAGTPLATNFNVVIVQLVGDWDLNGQQTAADIPAAMNALVDLNSYRIVHNLTTAQLVVLGDVNDDVHIGNTDLSALLQLLIHGSGSGQVTGDAKPGAASNASIATGAKPVAPIVVEHADRITEHRFGAFETNSQVVQVPNGLSDLARASNKVKMVAIVQNFNIKERTQTFRPYKQSATSERRRPVYRNSVDEAFASENLLDDSPQSKSPSAL